MNLAETVKLLAITQAALPAMKMTELTPDVWQQLLADVPFDAAQAAVYRHAKTSSGYLAPADIRRLIAQDAGLLPPLPEEALRLAGSWARERGEWDSVEQRQRYRIKIDDLPLPLANVCRHLGSSFINESPTGMLHKRFMAAYADQCREHEQIVLSGDLGLQIIEARRRRELPPSAA